MWIFCEDVQRWYLYMGNGNLRLPRYGSELEYKKMNKDIEHEERWKKKQNERKQKESKRNS